MRKEYKENVINIEIMGTVDRKLNKFISKKFLVWIISTIFLGMGIIENEQWYFITVAYVGIQGLADGAKNLRTEAK